MPFPMTPQSEKRKFTRSRSLSFDSPPLSRGGDDDSRHILRSEDAADAFPLIPPWEPLKVIEGPAIQLVSGIPERTVEPETVLRYQPILPPLGFQTNESCEFNHESFNRSVLN